MRQASKAIRKHILALLSDGQFHSGETIAQQVGLSRTAVAGHISQLADWGLDVFKVKGKGYRLERGFPDKNMGLVDAWRTHQEGNAHTSTCGIFDLKQWKKGPHCRDYFFLSHSLAQKINQVSVNTETDASDHQPIRLVLDV